MELKLDFEDVLLVPKRSEIQSRKEIEVTREIKCRHSGKIINCCPVIAANLYNTGTFAMGRALVGRNMLTALHKHYSIQDICRNYHYYKSNYDVSQRLIYTLGIQNEDLEKLNKVYNATKIFPSLVCIDVPNGYISKLCDVIKYLRDSYPEMGIIAGNVVTPNMTEQLILSGADIVKVGIGSGQFCTTRLVTGVGYPQLSSIMECADAAHGLGGHIISDGGVTCVGDICKALCAGADFVMCGGLFVGYEENEGEWELDYNNTKIYGYRDSELLKDGKEIPIPDYNNSFVVLTHNKNLDGQFIITPRKKSLKAFGMSSKHANETFSGGLKDYRASEGREKVVPYKGPVDALLQEIEGGLRSCGAYIGAKRIKDFPKCASFIRCNRTHNKVLE